MKGHIIFPQYPLLTPLILLGVFFFSLYINMHSLPKSIAIAKDLHFSAFSFFFCRYCLSSSNKAVAALLCSLYPHFPISSSDNRSVANLSSSY